MIDGIIDLMNGAQTLAGSLKADPESRAIVSGYAEYLLSEDHPYPKLAAFLDWYGVRFMLPAVRKVLDSLPEYRFLTELGPGTGWLIGSLAKHGVSRHSIDRRDLITDSWKDDGVHVETLDLEKPEDLDFIKVGYNLRENVILANHLLHCLDNAADVIKALNKCTWVVMEPYSGWNQTTFPSWENQMRQFGATPIDQDVLEAMFTHAGMTKVSEKTVFGQYVKVFRK